MIRKTALALAGLMMATSAQAAELKVGFVYVGPVGDFGWTYQHDQGRLAVEAEFGDRVETTYVESVPEGPDAERVIRQLAASGHGLIFTTSIPPAVAAGALASVRLVKGDHALRERHQERAATLKARFTAQGFPLMPSVCHIVPVLIGDAATCKQASDLLLERHRVYVQPINFPTVPRGTERLRFTPTPLHDDAVMDRLLEAMEDVWSKLSLPRRDHDPAASPARALG